MSVNRCDYALSVKDYRLDLEHDTLSFIESDSSDVYIPWEI